MTAWTSESDLTGDYSHIGGSLYVVVDYVALGYFVEEDFSTTWTPESNPSTVWTSV